jgi:lysophospholipase L1-like esterase
MSHRPGEGIDVRTGLGGRLLAALAAAAAAVATAGCSPSSSSPSSPSSSSSRSSADATATTGSSGAGGSAAGTYLALGDSIGFGYRPRESDATYADAANFTGYPELIGEDLGLRVLNATCPGETTASFLDVTAPSNGCEGGPASGGGYRTSHPLHVEYDSADQSQLDYALSTLQETPGVVLVTLQLGANDGFLCQARTTDQCASEVAGVAATVQANLDTALEALRTRGGYGGPIVVLSYYALDYADGRAAPTQVLNSGIERAAAANGATVASGFEAFRPAAEQAGGSPVRAGLVFEDDVHPTAAGQRLLADAVLAVVPR